MTTKTNTLQITSEKTQDRSKFLRNVLRGNMIFSGLAGIDFLIAGGWLSKMTGIAPLIFPIIGAGLLAWAFVAYRVSAAETISRNQVIEVIAGDLIWVLASVVVLAFGLLPLTVAGKWGMAIIADIVGTFALLQYIGLRRIS